MDTSPVPIPMSQRWREFRIRVFPALAFLIGLVFVIDLWKAEIAAPSMIGEVQGVQTAVISTSPGMLAELDVERFQQVRQGQSVGRLLPTDPDTLKASLAVMELDLRLVRARMALDRERNDLNYQEMRIDHMNRRLELAAARAGLQFAESEFTRMAKQHHDKIVSDSDYDIAFRDQERLRAEVSEKALIVEELELALERLRPPGPANGEESGDLVDAVVAAHEAKLLLLEGPVTLRAPIDGMISSVNFQPGEKIMAGQPIVTISALKSDRIVGYARQPLRIVPKVGDEIQVRTRGAKRQIAAAKVLQVGSEVQAISASLGVRAFDTSQERGLPFLVMLPPGLEVYPGEQVDLLLKR